MKDTKTILKEAREAIKQKNYDLSSKLCKHILKEEKENYTALVFLGVSLQETDHLEKAIATFKVAVKVNPGNPLAWNGVINYYEKIDTKEGKTELLKAYLSVIKIETTEKRILEYSQKIESLFEFGEVSEIVKTIYSLIKEEKVGDPIGLWICLVNVLSKRKDFPSDLSPMYEEALQVVLNNQKTVCIEFYSEYLNLLYKLNKFDSLLSEAKKMHSIYETDWVSLRWICKIFNENYVENQLMMEKDDVINQFSESLSRLEKPSPTALFTKSILLLEKGNVIEAKDGLLETVKLMPGLVHAWILLLKCNIRLLLFPEAITAGFKVDKFIQNSNNLKPSLKDEANILLVETLSKSREESDLERVLEIYERMTDDLKAKCLPHKIRVHTNLGNFIQSKVLLPEIKDVSVRNLLNAQLLRIQKKYGEALAVLDSEDVDFSEWWLEKGLIYWDLGQFSKSLIPYLKAAKLDPANYKCFLLLGHYYVKSNDVDKARRCYEKAVKINAKSAEAGIELSKIYRKLKNWEANSALLQTLTSGVINRNNSWAWLQLGISYLDQFEYDQAINNLRFVIRIDDSNVYCWEALADAYLAKGSYTSSLKCYERASELAPSSLYPRLQMANINLLLGQLTEAQANFCEILQSSKLHVPTLKGLAETYLAQAKECYYTQRYGTSRDYIQLSVENLITAIKQRSDFSCLWKLLGDCCVFVSKLPENYCCLLVPSSFIVGGEATTNKVLEQTDLLDLAAKCYCKSLNLTNDNYFVWHDLGVCYLKNALAAEDKCEFGEFIKKAQEVAHYCTVNNSTHSPHWNLLANVALHSDPPNYRLAQHALIKALLANDNSAVGWCNLGTLYFILEDYKLANEAFSQAQRSDPNYVNSWIGQALLAEKFAHGEAMDLFRHSTQLGMHQQGALGYAHWVCKTLKESSLDSVIYSIHDMHAIPVACDFISWYTENNPLDASAWNMLGILRERMQLKSGALEAFKYSLGLSNNSKRDMARVNYGRSLAKLGDFAEAIKMFTKVDSATFNSGAELALALFKDKQYKESYEAYDSALHWLTEELSAQSELLVALSSMAYMFEGPEAAKTLLYQSVQLKDPSPWGFFATLSLGLLHDDLNLAKLVFDELEGMKDRKDCIQHYTLLGSLLYFLQGDFQRSIRLVSKMVHRHPNEASLWLTLSSLLIRLQKGTAAFKSASKCAHVAMRLSTISTDIAKVLSIVSMSSLAAGDDNGALLSAQKAIHCNPHLAESWSVFGSALLATQKIPNAHIREMMTFGKQFSKSDALTSWFQKTTILCT